jgi:hypothetical protein
MCLECGSWPDEYDEGRPILKTTTEPIGMAPMSKVGARKFYDALAAEKKDPAIVLLSSKIRPNDRVKMRQLMSVDPNHWYLDQHFGGGMFVRNLLRQHGFGEKYWPIWNLDDIYVFLLEDAISKES